MESIENQLNSYYKQQRNLPAAAVTAATSPTNDPLPNTDGSHMVYPLSVPSAVSSQLEPTKRKRGRPRKYGTPEQALAAKKASKASYSSFSGKEEKGSGLGGDSFTTSYFGVSRKPESFALGNAGQGFTLHVISVASGEDVSQKILLFMQQSKRAICILSASGSIYSASLLQPATSGGNITYEGRFEIISLSGSYVRMEDGRSAGGLSVCLSNTDGQMIGGGVGGPLKAAGPVKVIVGTFVVDTKIDASAKVDGSATKLQSPIGGDAVSSVGFQSVVDSYCRNSFSGNGDHQTIGEKLLHDSTTLPTFTTHWWRDPDARNAAGYEMIGKLAGQRACQSPENRDYKQITD